MDIFREIMSIDLREITLISIIVRIFFSIVLGGILGIERGLKNRPAGLRTYMLVSLGACAVSLTNQYVAQVFDTSDPVRMSAQVISGIGFLGAGTIIVTSRNKVKGLTTAAGLWTAACLGIAIGIGFYEVALVAGFGVIAILTVLHNVDNFVKKNAKTIDLYIELKKNTTLRRFLRYTHEKEFETSNIQMEEDNVADVCAFIVTLKSVNKITREDMLLAVREFPGLRHLEEI